jgi:hypothetical protein
MLSERLAALLAQEALPWDQAEEWEFDSFLNVFTLHDSLWLALQFDVAWAGAATAAIAFDPIWNKMDVQATSTCAGRPTLFIRFPNIAQICKANYAGNSVYIGPKTQILNPNDYGVGQAA